MNPIELEQPTLEQPINWLTAIFLVIFHLGALAALFFISWKPIAVAFVLHWLAICFGISMGYHRLLTHRSYKVPRWIEYFFAMCGTMTLEGGPVFWVATHRVHHQFSDRPGDPHSPRDGGFNWAHIGWLLVGESKHSNTRALSRYAPDLARDKFHCLLNDYHWVPLAVTSAALLYFGGISYLLWGTFFRVCLGLHFTWLVNSATHLWGGRRFQTRDDSRNNWWVALLTFGEGWHNNHHAHPTSARHGLAWYEFDMSWCQIWLLRKLGVAKSVKVASTTESLPVTKAA